MKIMKTIGTVLSLPLSLFKILVLICLIPVTFVEKLLNGELKEWFKKGKFLFDSFKAFFKSFKEGNYYRQMTGYIYTDGKGKDYCMRNYTIADSGRVVRHTIYETIDTDDTKS